MLWGTHLWRAGLLVVLCSAALAQSTVTEFSSGLTVGSSPAGIVAAPDGALWFTEFNGNKIGRITTAGSIGEYSGLTGSGPVGIVVGPDGALWFTECYNNINANSIGRITTAGLLSEYSANLTTYSCPYGIAVGSDGALWFTEFFTGMSTSAGPEYIAAGSDGALWFTEFNLGRIGRITTAGVITEYSLASGSNPVGI